jgi:acyl-CoA synthetase (AMP-forming)/AMP-acid ligase II
VILANKIEFIVAAFGIWKAGATLLPFSPQLREAELGLRPSAYAYDSSLTFDGEMRDAALQSRLSVIDFQNRRARHARQAIRDLVKDTFAKRDRRYLHESIENH